MKDKKNIILLIALTLELIIIGISFAYFVSGIEEVGKTEASGESEVTKKLKIYKKVVIF